MDEIGLGSGSEREQEVDKNELNSNFLGHEGIFRFAWGMNMVSWSGRKGGRVSNGKGRERDFAEEGEGQERYACMCVKKIYV